MSEKILDAVMVDLEKEQIEIKEDGIDYIVDSTYRVFSDGSRVLACTSKRPKEVEVDVTPEPTQLDVIEANTSYIVMMMEV